MTAAKFEQYCGKGEAKKWKSTIWATGENMELLCPMGEWLTRHNLDRKTLQTFQQNALAVKAWEEYRSNPNAQDGNGESGADSDRETESDKGDGARNGKEALAYVPLQERSVVELDSVSNSKRAVACGTESGAEDAEETESDDGEMFPRICATHESL